MTEIDIEKLEVLIRLAKQHGLQSLTVGDIHIVPGSSLAPLPVVPFTADARLSEGSLEASNGQETTDPEWEATAADLRHLMSLGT